MRPSGERLHAAWCDSTSSALRKACAQKQHAVRRASSRDKACGVEDWLAVSIIKGNRRNGMCAQ
jgi:hypothetical protein